MRNKHEPYQRRKITSPSIPMQKACKVRAGEQNASAEGDGSKLCRNDVEGSD